MPVSAEPPPKLSSRDSHVRSPIVPNHAPPMVEEKGGGKKAIDVITKENDVDDLLKLTLYNPIWLKYQSPAAIDPLRESSQVLQFRELEPDLFGCCIAPSRVLGRRCQGRIRRDETQLAAQFVRELRTNNPRGAPSTEELTVLAQLMLCVRYHRHLDLATMIASAWSKELSVPSPLNTSPIEEDVSMPSAEAIIRHREGTTSETEFKEFGRPDEKNIVSTIVRCMKNIRSVPQPAGYIYMIHRSGTPSMIKIGITRKWVGLRLEEIAKHCHYKPELIHYQEANQPRNLERLVHVSFLGQHREERRCNASKGCGHHHQEWFEVDHDLAILTIKRWANWLSIFPYTSLGLDPFWKTNLFRAEQLPSLDAFNQWLERTTQSCIQNGDISWRGNVDGQFHTVKYSQEFIDNAGPSSPISPANSIFSDSGIGSSVSSTSSVSGTVEEFSTLLLEDKAIRWLHVVAFEKFGAENFTKNISRLLREYANDLQGDNMTAYESQAIKFVQIRAHHIANSLQNKIQPERLQVTKELDNLSSQAPNSHEMLDRHSQEAEQPSELFMLEHNLKTPANLNSTSPHTDPTSDSSESGDIGELWIDSNRFEPDDIEPSELHIRLPYMGLVREFMFTSEAYKKLRHNLRDLVLPPGEQEYGEFSEVEEKNSLMTIEENSTFLHPGQAGIDLRVAAKMDPMNDDLAWNSAMKFLPEHGDHAVMQEKGSLDDISPTFASGSTAGPNTNVTNGNEKVQLSDLITTTAFPAWTWNQPLKFSELRSWAKVRWNKSFRPRVEPGYRRIEWTCDCGEALYGDFDNSNQEAVNKLAAKLVTLASDRVSASQVQLELGEHQQHSSNTAGSIEYQSTSCTAISATSESEDSQHSPTPILNSVATEILVPPYVALCINTGGIPKTLTEVDVSDAVSDAEVFERLRTSYNNTRGYRKRFSFLIHPTALQFVKFNLFSLRHGYVAVYKTEKSYSIPSADVQEYRYSPVPLHDPPPMPPEVFLHYLESGDTDNCHKARFWVNRIPKRLKKKIINAPDIPVCGWGIYIREGPNKSAVFWIVMTTTLAGVLASVLWSNLHDDIQGGMGLGSVILALPSIIMAAFLYRLTEE